MSINIAGSDAEIDSCFDVISLLRPHLHRHDFVRLVRSMEPQGYRLAYLTDDDAVQAVAGYRIIDMLRTGRMLEVDDLVTSASARSKGYGKQLLNWCYDLARSSGCSVVELDSAVHRADAHRFYFRERMYVLGFHFSHSVT
jgi:GNAT superfamily N-acetyltransferase